MAPLRCFAIAALCAVVDCEQISVTSSACAGPRSNDDGGLPSTEPSTERCSPSRAPQVGVATQGSALVQRAAIRQKSVMATETGCTEQNQDPYGQGGFIDCCAGLEKKVGQWSSHRSEWYFLCRPAPTPTTRKPRQCTEVDNDPYGTGELIRCCDGLTDVLGKWSSSRSKPYFLCRPDGGDEGSADGNSAADNGGGDANGASAPVVRFLEWNVHYSNKDTNAIAQIVKPNRPDIFGICELTASVSEMARSLTDVLGARWKVQPGRNSWAGYGTDIFYNADRWQALDGGVRKANCGGSRGGARASNWAVLRHRASGRTLIAGGTHLSYCAQGCDDVHACELTEMYRRFDEMKQKYPGSGVVWMGDTNRGPHTKVMKRLFTESTGSMSTYKVDDLARTRGNTYFSGGSAIDFILGEHGVFQRRSGGTTGQGTKGRHLAGADHFPVYAEVLWK